VAEALLEDGHQIAIALDGHDARRALEQRRGERAEAGPDLDHGAAFGGGGELGDARTQPGIDEEVLAERSLGPEAAGAKQGQRARWAGFAGLAGTASPSAHATASVTGSPPGSSRSRGCPASSGSPASSGGPASSG